MPAVQKQTGLQVLQGPARANGGSSSSQQHEQCDAVHTGHHESIQQAPQLRAAAYHSRSHIAHILPPIMSKVACRSKSSAGYLSAHAHLLDVLVQLESSTCSLPHGV